MTADHLNAAGADLGAPRFTHRSALKEPVPLCAGRERGSWTGPDGTPAAGITVAVATAVTPAETLLTASVTADSRREGVQIALPLELPLDWLSYVIAPGAMYDGKIWRSFGVKRPGCRAFSLIRRSLECTRDVPKVIALLRSRGEAARRNLDAMADTAFRFGHLGYTVDRDTGDVLWGDSSCGAFGIEPLVRGAAWFGEPLYFETARRLAEYYVTHFLAKGYTCGGVGDALMAVDSESGYALLAGLVHLHAASGEPLHLEWARQAADLFTTWVLCYDARLPPDSPLGSLGIQPRGAVFANVQNQHGAPGICTASGEALLRLYEATGEERYLRLLEDIAGCIPQMIVRPGQEQVWGDLPPGSITERLMTTDGMERCGHTARLSTWSEISLLLTVRELRIRTAPELQ